MNRSTVNCGHTSDGKDTGKEKGGTITGNTNTGTSTNIVEGKEFKAKKENGIMQVRMV